MFHLCQNVRDFLYVTHLLLQIFVMDCTVLVVSF